MLKILVGWCCTFDGLKFLDNTVYLRVLITLTGMQKCFSFTIEYTALWFPLVCY